MANITLPDGTVIPEYALETTQASMEKLLTALVGSDEKAMKHYEALVKNAKQQTTDGKAANQTAEESLNALKEIQKDTKAGKSMLGSSLSVMGNVADGTSNLLIKLGVAASGAALSGISLLAKNAYNLGTSLADLGQVGIGLEGINDTTPSTIASLNRLGLTSTEAADQLFNSASTIAAIGQKQFVQVNAVLADMTNSGARFGLTMSGLANIAAEDLETRQKLGILDNLNASQAAQRSQELYQSQMDATKLLGKTINDIRLASRNTLQGNAEFALRVLDISSRLDAESARGFVQGMEMGLGALAGSGLGDSLIDQIGNEIGAAVAFASDGGQELFRTLNFINPALTESVRNMNQIAKSDSPQKIAGAMDKFNEQLLNTAADMGSEEFNALSAQLLAGNFGQFGRDLAISLGEIRIAAGNLGKDTAAEFSQLAQGAKTFDNAMAKFSGGITGMFNEMSGALGPAVGGLAGAFTDTMNELPAGATNLKTYMDESGKILRTYTDKSGNEITENITDQIGIATQFKFTMRDISQALAEAFGGAEGDFKNLGDMLRANVVPAIRNFGDWFQSGGFEKIKSAFSFVGGVLSGFGEAIKFVADIVTTTLMPMFGSGDGDKLSIDFAELGKTIGLSIAGFIALTKTVKLLNAGMGVAKTVGGLFKGGAGAASSAASSVGGAAGGAAAKTGAGIAKLGRGIGSGVGAIFSGLGKGLAAVPVAALKGAGIIAGAITILAGGVKAAAFILNMGGEDGLKQLSSGFASFNDIDGRNLVSVGAGLTALGLGLAAFGAGSVVGALGNLTAGLMDSMNKFFGGSTIFEKVEEFAKYNFPVDRIKNNAEAIVAYAKAMASAGGGTVASSMGNFIASITDGLVKLFGGDTPLEKVQKFGDMQINSEGILQNADALRTYGIAMSELSDIDYPGNTIGSFLSDIGSGLLSLLGGDSPLEKLQDFGDMNINAQGINTNATAIATYANAMQSLSSLGDIADPNTAALDAYTSSLKSLTELDADSLVSISQAMERINRNLIGSNANTVSVTNDVLNTTDTQAVVPPTPAIQELVGPPTPESAGTSSVMPPAVEKSDSGRDLLSAVRRTNQKLDTLISATQKAS